MSAAKSDIKPSTVSSLTSTSRYMQALASASSSLQDSRNQSASASKNDLINAKMKLDNRLNTPNAGKSSSTPSGSKLYESTPQQGHHTNARDAKKTTRRRKANRACSHCQKAHLTCDDSRPCERCVKKGLADSCTDGARKKAKYLLDDDELLALKNEKQRKKHDSPDDSKPTQKSLSSELPNPPVKSSAWPPIGIEAVPAISSLSQSNPTLAPAHLEATSNSSGPNESTPQQSDNDLYGSMSNFSPASSNGLKANFGSESASLEYSILSSMLNGIDPSWLSGSPEGQATDTQVGQILGNETLAHVGVDSMPWSWEHQNTSVSPWRKSASTNNASTHAVEPLHHMDATLAAGSMPSDGVAAYDALEVPSPKGVSNGADVHDPKARRISVASVEQNAESSKVLAAVAAAGLDHKPDDVWKERVKHVYGDRTRPYPYTEGYHFLIKYVTANLEKADVLRIVRALAIFRPSLIALQMPLTEDDEVFVERSIQRTVLEFEKLISLSGTPTVVWRRTCEIVVVGAEFSMLTQWSKDHLHGRYIYEFFEKPSILDYWERFAVHAFENTAQSIMMPITLRTSTGGTTKCAACFSIKRDIFDLPSLIVGNFLPILS